MKRDYEALEERYRALWSEKEALRYKLEELLSREQNFEEQSQKIHELHENVRGLKHDMKNHMLVLATFLEEENYTAAQDYTSEILDRLNAIHSYIATDNSLLNHVLNQKLETARSKKIAIKAEIENLSFRRMESMDFTALLSNLLDNAIEACEKETDKDLQIVIGTRRGYDTILVKNRIARSVLSDNPNLRTDKEDKDRHGMGVKKIRELTEKYEGLCDFYEEDKFFCASVFIPQ